MKFLFLISFNTTVSTWCFLEVVLNKFLTTITKTSWQVDCQKVDCIFFTSVNNWWQRQALSFSHHIWKLQIIITLEGKYWNPPIYNRQEPASLHHPHKRTEGERKVRICHQVSHLLPDTTTLPNPKVLGPGVVSIGWKMIDHGRASTLTDLHLWTEKKD